MKNHILLILAFNTLLTYSQMALPINFEEGQVTTESFIDFNGGTGTVVDNPFITDDNPSNTVGKIVRDGGDIWAGSYLTVSPLDFTSETTIKMNVYSVSPGLLVKFKLEDDNDPVTAAVERDAYTTKYNQWETLTWSFSGEQSNIFQKLVLMFDFGNTGNGTDNSTFYFDDIYQFDPTGGLAQIDLPITYDDSSVYYSLIPFGDEEGASDIIYNSGENNLAYVAKSSSAATWAGVTVSNESGLENNIPVSSSNSKMYVHTYVTGSSNTGIPVRLKIENKNDPTQSVETEAYTTVVDAYEVLEFDFNNEATGTAALNESYPFNMASLFFNFGSAGDDQTVYYFDNISFGSPISLGFDSVSNESFKLYPNPVEDYLNIDSSNTVIKNIDVFNILGKKIYSTNSSDRLDMSSYNAGIYFVKVNNSTFKIVKK
ncbi:T9SS type A sorting domain-containing protein [Flavobacteriaceae bacterium]|nr:T9SS type A sorting domain-containing protein [Flavobacteriaceae bacterium]MDC1493111.1 T9SS type A sorting domain-containing protein [Flavobacteriaceae bacterium]